MERACVHALIEASKRAAGNIGVRMHFFLYYYGTRVGERVCEAIAWIMLAILLLILRLIDGGVDVAVSFVC